MLKVDGSGGRAGHVHIYGFVGGTWTQVGADIEGEAAGDVSGTSVSLSSDGNLLAVGASRNDYADEMLVAYTFMI